MRLVCLTSQVASNPPPLSREDLFPHEWNDIASHEGAFVEGRKFILRQILPIRILPRPIYQHRHSRMMSAATSVDDSCPIKGIPHPLHGPDETRHHVLMPIVNSTFPGNFHAASHGMTVVRSPWRQQE